MRFLKKPGADDHRKMTDAEMRAPSKFYGIRYMDLKVLETLKKQGCDLTRKRHVLFYLYFADESGARASAEVLRGRGYEVSVKEPWKKIPKWSVIAESRDHALIPDFLRETTDVCEQLAANHGGEYDGWEAGPDLE